MQNNNAYMPILFFLNVIKTMMARSLCSRTPNSTELSQAIDILKHTIEAVEEEAKWSAIEGMGTATTMENTVAAAAAAFSSANPNSRPGSAASSTTPHHGGGFFGILSAKRKEKPSKSNQSRRRSSKKKHSLDPLLPLCCWQISRCYWQKLLAHSKRIKFARSKGSGVPVEALKGIIKCKEEMKLYLEKGLSYPFHDFKVGSEQQGGPDSQLPFLLSWMLATLSLHDGAQEFIEPHKEHMKTVAVTEEDARRAGSHLDFARGRLLGTVILDILGILLYESI
jgi:hypothetical protein